MAFSLSIGGSVHAGEEASFDPLAYARALADQAVQDKILRNLPIHVQVAREVELTQALAELNLPENDVGTIMEEIEKGLQADSEENLEKIVDAIKWQNTLVGTFKSPYEIDRDYAKTLMGEKGIQSVESFLGQFPDLSAKVGIYKKDVAGISLTVADAASDVLLYKNLTKRRIANVMDLIKKDYNGFLRALDLSLEAEGKHEEQRGENPPNEYFVRNVACSALRKYVSQEHRLMGTFPFNKHVLAPLIVRWGWEKVSAALRERWFPEITPSLPHENVVFKTERAFKIAQASSWAYIKQDDGTLKALKGIPPVSLSYCFSKFWNFFYPSSVDFGNTIRRGSGGLQFLNTTIGLHIPNVLFSDTALVLYDFLGIGYSAKCFDESMSVRWTEYAVDKRKDFKLALEEYKRCSQTATISKEELIKAEKVLRNLVEEGHASKSWFPMSLVQQWRNFRKTGGNKITMLTGAWVAAVSTVKAAILSKKAYDWWKSQ